MTNKTERISFVITPEDYAEAKRLGINTSKAAREGVLAEIARQKKLRELLGEN